MGNAEVNEINIQIESAVAVKAAETLDEQQVNTQDGVINIKLYGDVTDDGNISAYDAARVLQHVVDLNPLSGEPLSLADVNGKNGVTSYDAALILMKTVGTIEVFPVLEEDENSAPPALLTTRTLSVGNAQIKERSIEVPIELDITDNVISGDIKIGYNSNALKFIEAQKTELTDNYDLLTKARNDEIQLCFAGDTPMVGNGTIFRMCFQIQDENAEKSDFEVKYALLNEGVKLQVQNRTVDFVPAETALLNNYPNPFNPETWIPYQLAKDTEVLIELYDITGKMVRKLDLGYHRKGYYTSKNRAAHWDGRNDLGERVASGLYFYRMQTEDKSFIKKLVVIK